MRLGTRGSDLAMAQARLVAGRLRETGAAGEVELVPIATSGDRGDRALDKRRWIDAIEAALAEGEIDLAVHSAKDVPGVADLAPGMRVGAVLPRGDARDALVGAPSLEDLPAGARVGTCSLRRRAQLLSVRPDLDVRDLRGNVPTRLARLDAGEADAIVLAAAGLERLGLTERIGALLDPAVFVPAPGQGVLVIEGRELPPQAIDSSAQAALEAERTVVEQLGASCHTPVGCHDDGEAIAVFAGAPDGSAWLRDRVAGGDAAGRLRELLDRLETMGARELVAGSADA